MVGDRTPPEVPVLPKLRCVETAPLWLSYCWESSPRRYRYLWSPLANRKRPRRSGDTGDQPSLSYIPFHRLPSSLQSAPEKFSKLSHCRARTGGKVAPSRRTAAGRTEPTGENAAGAWKRRSLSPDPRLQSAGGAGAWGGELAQRAEGGDWGRELEEGRRRGRRSPEGGWKVSFEGKWTCHPLPLLAWTPPLHR